MMRISLVAFIMFQIQLGWSQDLKIRTAHMTTTELMFKKKLKRILEEYDVEKWIYTDTITIDDTAIPRSHPVLTLNTRPQSDLSLLATFIHEQVHWFLEENDNKTNDLMKELRTKFPTVPVGNGEGARDEYSSYLHLIVNFLEFDGIKQLAGERAAQAVIARKAYYKWIYRQVRANRAYLAELIRKHGLRI